MIRPAALLLVLLLCACGRAPGLDRLAAGEAGRVADVVSGDTLALDSGLEVRLAGIEAPKGGQPYASEARATLATLADGHRAQLLYGGARRDRYGRALAHVRLARGDRWVEQALLRAGAVRARTWADNRAMAGALLEAEAYARNRRVGLWKLAAYRVLLPGETFRAEGFQIVEGRVRRLGQGAATRLEFGEAGSGFAAEIPAAALKDFKTAGKTPEQLRGRHLRVRGWLRYGDRGPWMALDHPEQVELLKEAD